MPPDVAHVGVACDEFVGVACDEFVGEAVVVVFFFALDRRALLTLVGMDIGSKQYSRSPSTPATGTVFLWDFLENMATRPISTAALWSIERRHDSGFFTKPMMLVKAGFAKTIPTPVLSHLRESSERRAE